MLFFTLGCPLHLQVVMLSSVTDLLRYISENQLTSEFGGTLDYCHSDWIVLRTVNAADLFWDSLRDQTSKYFCHPSSSVSFFCPVTLGPTNEPMCFICITLIKLLQGSCAYVEVTHKCCVVFLFLDTDPQSSVSKRHWAVSPFTSFHLPCNHVCGVSVVFASTPGDWEFCCDSQRHRSDAAGLRDRAGRDGGARQGESHRASPGVSNRQVQETQGSRRWSDVFYWSTVSNTAHFIISFVSLSLWQDAIRSVSKEGRHLLSSLEASGREDDSQWDVKLDWETVQR